MKTRTYPRHLKSRMDRYRKKKPPFSFTTYTQRERETCMSHNMKFSFEDGEIRINIWSHAIEAECKQNRKADGAVFDGIGSFDMEKRISTIRLSEGGNVAFGGRKLATFDGSPVRKVMSENVGRRGRPFSRRSGLLLFRRLEIECCVVFRRVLNYLE